MMTMPSHNLPAQLEQIGLRAIPGELDDFLARAAKLRWSPRQILEQLAQTEAAERAHRSLERRLRVAEIKKFKPMADFDWSWPKKIERDVIERALTLDFLAEGRNLILVGTNGLGKTMIAQNLCHAAVLAGHSVLFRSAASLLEELHRQSPEGRQRKLRTYANVGLLCVDEVGYLSFDDKSADLLYEVINRRYERKSVVLTTNRPFKEWNEVFPNAACIVTLLDRRKDMVISGGFNIYPSDLESVLRQNPGVLEAAVVGVPSEEWGETPVAFVVPASGAMDAGALRAWANERLGKTQRLADVRYLSELPRSDIGKVLKRELRERYTAG